MNRGRGRRARTTQGDQIKAMESLRLKIAESLAIEPERLRYQPLEEEGLGRFGTSGDHWQIFYKGRWCELPWHHIGPQWVTRAMVRQWWDD